jgi:site-specific recombinase XerD
VTAADTATTAVDLIARYDTAGPPSNRRRRRRAARAFLDRFGELSRWERATLAQQLAADAVCGRFVAWLIVAGALRPSAAYLLACRGRLAAVGDIVHPHLSAQFLLVGEQLGFAGVIVRRQWSALLQIAALTAAQPTRLSAELINAALMQFRDAAELLGHSRTRNLSAEAFGMQSVLFHLGMLNRLPGRNNGRGGRRTADWERIALQAPILAATLHDYLEQLSVRFRPNSMKTIDTSLRLFAGYLTEHHPDVTAVADITRTHVQGYKSWLAVRPGHRGPQLANQTLRGRLGVLAAFFNRLAELDIADAPNRPPIWRSDLPIKDDPLPRFIDDAASAKLHVAAQAHPDLFTRTAIELLARTGMRKSELLGLTIDAVVQIGSAYWLRIPIGKLHTDRYVPLHPQLKALLDQWLLRRGDTVRSNLMFIEKGRRINASRLDTALTACATTAGIGHITAHQLRHTLATQAINRGMSLEAIAALLGHKSMSMTLVYARIADRTVADEYFAVTEKVEALYGQARQLPADAEGTHMANLRKEADRRMLGNGYCARPAELDCHFESICEACTFFVTTIEFRPTLQRQRDDAETKGQRGRQQIFQGLIDRLDPAAS